MKGKKSSDKYLRLVGNNRNRLPPSTIKNLKVLPECPDYLGKDARAMWNRLGNELTKKGILPPLDVDSFAALCICYGNALEAQRILDKEGNVIPDR